MKGGRPVYDRFGLSGQKAAVRAGGGEIPKPDSDRSFGTRFPNALCTAAALELSINPNTIQRAYMQLEQEGLIYPVKGKGNFIADSEEVRKSAKLPIQKN